MGMQNSSCVAPFFFLANVPFLSFFLIQKGCGHAYNVPLVTPILNIYGFVGLDPSFFLTKISLLASFFF